MIRATLLCCSLLLCTCAAQAQIAFDAGTGAPAGVSVSSVTFAHTCTGSNRVLFVGVSILQAGGANAVSSVTYAGVNLTLVRREVRGNNGSELWRLVAPATGTNNVVVDMGGITTLRIWAVAVSLTGVDQTSPVEADNAANGNSTAPSVAVTTSSDNAWVIDMFVPGNNTATIGAGQTERAASLEVSTKRGISSTEGPVSPAGSVTMSWTLQNTGDWVIVAAAIKPVVPARRHPVWLGDVLSDGVLCATQAGDEINVSKRECEVAGISGRAIWNNPQRRNSSSTPRRSQTCSKAITLS